MPHYDDVTEADCSIDPVAPVQSVAHPYDQHGWTLAATGVEENDDGHERIVRSHILHYMDAQYDPHGSPHGSGGTWRHTFELDSLAFVLHDSSYYDPVGGPPGGADWYVPESDSSRHLEQSAVRIRSASNDPEIDTVVGPNDEPNDAAIGVRRGQDLVGFVDGRSFVDELWNDDERAEQFAQAINESPWTEPEPSTRDLGELSTEFERQDELQEAHETLGTTAVSIAITLGAGGVPGAIAGLGFFLLTEFGDRDGDERNPEPVPFNKGFEGVLDHSAAVQGHRIVFDVYQPRCTYTHFTVESAFGGFDRSAKWHLSTQYPTNPGPECDDWGGPGNSDPSEISREDRFSTTSRGVPDRDWGNYQSPALPEVTVHQLGDGVYALDASASVTPNEPNPSYWFDVHEWTDDFDPDDPSTTDLGRHLFENSSDGPVQCVEVEEPGEYVVEVRPGGSDVAAWRRFTVSEDEFEPESRTLTIESVDGASRPYAVIVDGEVEKSTANGASIDPNDSVDGTLASGRVAGGKDSYEFTGTLQRISGDGLELTLDGQPVDVDDYQPEHTVTVESTDGSPARYSLEVSDDLYKSVAYGGSVSPLDVVLQSSNSAYGWVVGGRDSYAFDGSLQSISGNGIRVYLDGEEIDPDSV